MEPILAWLVRQPRARLLLVRVVTGSIVAGMAASLAVLVLVTGISSEDAARASAVSCQWSDGGVVTSGVTVADLDAQEMATATTIIGVAKGLGIPPQGWTIALAASLQESGLRPLPYGDRDSVGPFQQRAAWGPLADRTEPGSSARMFFVGGQSGQPGLLAIPGWEQLPVTFAAQAVQQSAFPDAYAKQVPLARALVQQLGGVTPPMSCSGGRGSVFAGFSLPLPAQNVHAPLADHWDHQPAVDLPASTGTPVYAVAGGVAGFTSEGDACGLGISLRDPSGNTWTYCHLSDRLVSGGSEVATGQQIGLVGTTGESSGPHLHLQLQVGDSLVCPQPVLDAVAVRQPPPPLGSLSRVGPCA